MNLPFSQACENNKTPILKILQTLLGEHHYVFEVGSGTGQHAVHFAPQLPHLTWQCADLPEHLPGIRQWLNAYPSANLPPPRSFDMNSPQWPEAFDALYSANTAHIMPWHLTQAMITQGGQRLPPGGRLILYGPFNYRGKYTSESNARFDLHLKQNDPARGIRDFEAVHSAAEEAGLEFETDHEMPANNRLLVWRKPAPSS